MVEVVSSMRRARAKAERKWAGDTEDAFCAEDSGRSFDCILHISFAPHGVNCDAASPLASQQRAHAYQRRSFFRSKIVALTWGSQISQGRENLGCNGYDWMCGRWE